MFCALWLLGAPAALAQSTGDSDARARHLYRNGELLYAEGRYADAIAAWKSAYKLSDRPLLLFNIANAEERIGRWEDALRTLNRYRAYAPLDERELLTSRIANIELHLQARRVVEPAPQTAYNPEPDPEPDPELEPDPPRRTMTPAVSTPLLEAPRPRERDVSRSLGRGPIVMYTVSGVGVVTGGIFAFRARAARAVAAEACRGQGTTFCPASAQGAIQQDQISSIVADVGFGVALTAAVAGTLMAVTNKTKANRTTMSLAPAVGGASLGLSSRF